MASATYRPDQPTGWLSSAFDSDSTPARLWLRGSVSNLPVGTYTAEVGVTSATAGGAARVITVVLKVSAAAMGTLVVKDRSNYIGDLAPGPGRVTGPGIDCSNGFGDCTEEYPIGTVVTLTQVPTPQTSLFRWTDACEGTPSSSSTCAATIGDSTVVGTWFVYKGYGIALTMQGPEADGEVQGSGGPPSFIFCQLVNGVQSGPWCSTFAIDGTRGFGMSARARFGSTFVGWSGDCSGSTNFCSLPPGYGRNYTVTATFARDPSVGNELNVLMAANAGPAEGTVTGGGIDCRLEGTVSSGTCRIALPVGAVVELTASPGPRTLFEGWSFDCENTGTPTVCRVTVSGPRQVGARFKPAS